MYEVYQDEVQFFVVYLREAHPLDGFSPLWGDGHPLVEDPITLVERMSVAKTCMSRLALQGIPAVVDDVDDAVGSAYAAHPDRLYLIGRNGTVVFRGGPGPFGFNPEDLEEAIVAELE